MMFLGGIEVRCSKNKVRNAENVQLLTTFEYFSLQTIRQVIIKNCEGANIKLLSKKRGKTLKKMLY